MEPRPTTLVAMPDLNHRRSLLLEHLRALRLDAYPVDTCREARDFVNRQAPLDLVITAVSLPDGNWCDILRYVVEHAEQANVVVACPVADEQFWSEALWRGVYDLLIEPFGSDEVTRVVAGAIRGAHRVPRLDVHREQDDSAFPARNSGTRFRAKTAG